MAGDDGKKRGGLSYPDRPFGQSDGGVISLLQSDGRGEENRLTPEDDAEPHIIMSLFGILFGIAMLFLIAKALLETTWGLVLIAFAISCHVLAWIFHGSAILLRILARLNKAANW